MGTLRHECIDPEQGDTFDDQGHVYIAADVAPHVNRDGRGSFVIRWLGECSKCGQAFEFKTGPRVYDAPRRCKPCIAKRPRPGKLLRPYKARKGR